MSTFLFQNIQCGESNEIIDIMIFDWKGHPSKYVVMAQAQFWPQDFGPKSEIENPILSPQFWTLRLNVKAYDMCWPVT